MSRLLVITFALGILAACNEEAPPPGIPDVDVPLPKRMSYLADTLNLTPAEYRDRVLGALVGSAIGDALGASTEMWNRGEIRLRHGWITDLTPSVRPMSPEGPWRHNGFAGTTTDDTRWKLLAVRYLTKYGDDLTTENFLKFILGYYDSLTRDLNRRTDILHPDSLTEQLQRVDWIREWARVALAYHDGPEVLDAARNRFYGGEMSCAGQLYTPVFGLIAPTPDSAYALAYRHTPFDLGYAKDISALVAAMTQVALRTPDVDSLLNVAVFVDPFGYTDSRLIGRIAFGVADQTRRAVLAARELRQPDDWTRQDSIDLRIPRGFGGTALEWRQQESVFNFLGRNQRAIAFHAAEIWQILIAGMAFCEGDFRCSMEFIVNYGRDNDTVAAVVGMILGAQVGYENLPAEWRDPIVDLSREMVGIDLEDLADELCAYAGIVERQSEPNETADVHPQD